MEIDRNKALELYNKLQSEEENKLKSLKQPERKACLKLAKYVKSQDESLFEIDQTVVNSVNNIREMIIKPVPHGPFHFLTRFFKGIENFLHLRVSSHRLYSELHSAADSPQKTEEPTVEKQIVEEPTVEEQIVEELTVEEPTSEEQIDEEQTVEEQTVKKLKEIHAKLQNATSASQKTDKPASIPLQQFIDSLPVHTEFKQKLHGLSSRQQLYVVRDFVVDFVLSHTKIPNTAVLQIASEACPLLQSYCEEGSTSDIDVKIIQNTLDNLKNKIKEYLELKTLEAVFEENPPEPLPTMPDPTLLSTNPTSEKKVYHDTQYTMNTYDFIDALNTFNMLQNVDVKEIVDKIDGLEDFYYKGTDHTHTDWDNKKKELKEQILKGVLTTENFPLFFKCALSGYKSLAEASLWVVLDKQVLYLKVSEDFTRFQIGETCNTILEKQFKNHEPVRLALQ